MGTSAELFGEVSHRYDSYILAVFLTKEGHSACLLGRLHIHDLGDNRKICLDLFIYQSLYLLDLLLGHRLEMSEVKTQSVRSYERTFLLYMRTENGLQCFLEQMGGAVVFAGVGAGCCVNGKSHLVADLEHAFYHMAHMAKHFVSTGGCGIRPLLDVWVLTHRIPFDRRSRVYLLTEGGVSAFAQQAELLSEVWFGGAAPTAVTDQMTSYILRGGLYGSMENRITVQQQKQGGKLRYAASRIFLPYDTLKHHYPVLEQHRWLTPLMEVRRWGKLMFCGGLKRSVRELRCNSATPRQQASETQSLLSVLNL